METTPCLVRPYVIPMLYCVVVSTTSFKTQPDFSSREIPLTDFHSGDPDALSVVLIQDLPALVFIDDHVWAFTNRVADSMVFKYHSSVSISCLPDNAIDNSDHTMTITVAMAVVDIEEVVSNYFL